MTHDISDFDDLYRRHAPVAFRRARLALGVDADAHAIVREVFLPLLDQPDRYRGHSRLTTSLYSAVTNACLNHLADPDTRARLIQANGRPRSAPHHGHRNEAAVRALLLRTPDGLAEIAVYYYLDELTNDEIARVLELSRVQVDELLGRLSLIERTRLELCPSDLILDAWIADELAANVATQVEKHLGHCEVCQGRRAAVAAERAEFLLMAPTFDRQQQRVERAAPKPAPKSRRSNMRKAGAAAAFALMAIGFVALMTLRPCADAPTGPAGGKRPISPPAAAPVR